MAGGVVAMSLVGWGIPATAALVNGGQVPHLGPLRALVAGLRLIGDGRWGDPGPGVPAQTCSHSCPGRRCGG